MTTWVVVGREQSGDEDDNVSATEVFGMFNTEARARAWLDSAPTFDGQVYELRSPSAPLLVGRPSEET